jgi:hypothetical protein
VQLSAADAVNRMNGPFIALTLQPEDEPSIPQSALSDGDLVVAAVFVVIIVIALGFDMIRTWWETNQWRRDARRRRREMR